MFAIEHATLFKPIHIARNTSGEKFTQFLLFRKKPVENAIFITIYQTTFQIVYRPKTVSKHYFISLVIMWKAITIYLQCPYQVYFVDISVLLLLYTLYLRVCIKINLYCSFKDIISLKL